MTSTPDYKRPTFFLLLTTLTLYPSPSPLFHMICLPIMILLHRHDPKLFQTCIPICLLLVTSVAEIWWGGKETWLESLMAAGERSSFVVGTVVGSIVGHHQLTTMAKGKGRTAWSDSLLFGMVWTSFGITHRCLGYDHTILTPSSARYETLRFLHRNFGPIGIDLLLSTSGYLVFMIIEVFFPSPSPEDRKLWEWIKMQPIDKDAIALATSWGSLASTAISPDGEPGTSPDWATTADQYTSEYESARTASSRADPGPSQSTRFAERTGLLPEPYTISNTYGTLRQADDLIDLESGRTMTSNFSFPSYRRSGQYRSEIPPDPLNLPRSPTGSTESDSDSDSTAVASSSDTSIGATLLRNLLTSRPSHPRYLRYTVIAIMLLWSLIFTQSLPDHLSLSAPLMEHTPLAVACIIPPVDAQLADMIYLSQTVSGRVKLIVWPEESIVVESEFGRDVAVEEVRLAIGVQYGVWTLMSVKVQETGKRERILVGVDGPVEAGVSGDEVEQGGTDWTVLLPPPTGVTRFNWTQEFPHFRPVHFAAIIPGNNSDHFPIPVTNIPPSLLIVPAQSTSEAQSAIQLTRTQEMAIKHSTPAFLCTSSSTGHGTSAVIDPAGRILFQQSGGQTWLLSLALWFREGQERPWTGYEDHFGAWVFGTLVFILSIQTSMGYIAKQQNPTLSHDHVSDMMSWSSRIRRSMTSTGGIM